MVYADSPVVFDDAIKVLKERIPVNSFSTGIIKYVDELDRNRDSFVKYKISAYEGCYFLRGSTSSEQNHSSVIFHLHANSRKYKVSLDTFAKDLFRRQKELYAKQLSVLGLLLIERHAYMDTVQMNPFNDDEKEQLLLAYNRLNLPSYKLFREEIRKSKHYLREEIVTENIVLIRLTGDKDETRNK